jgi:hypothetical protein
MYQRGMHVRIVSPLCGVVWIFREAAFVILVAAAFFLPQHPSALNPV